eukprot:TRINITY_DN6059_c0_g1_i2.p1 TRINITY_DN6059_c0_g1~~TRINITY_DN6059_c0_g1_i2.p1  ORF type:complete len:625 (+),score=70.41 TRINITY_DN6059_c0_g1_i2:144-1877(+)
MPCAAISGVIKHFDLIGEHDVLLNNTAWSGFSFLVGFLVVFRTSQAYARFWDGATATHRMRAEWCDAASAVIAFTKHSKADADTILRFKHMLVRLFSLFHAMALGELEGDDGERPRAFDLELIDLGGIDQESLRALCRTQQKVAMVFQWIQSFIIENISTGVLSIPPPILSRAFQELGNGMVAHHEALQIAEIPFPFPYAQACDCLLVIHWCLTPLITAPWTPGVHFAAMFSFVQVFIMWSLTNIAVEIEHPFGLDSNDLDAAMMQTDMNHHLLLLIHPDVDRTPSLSSIAILDWSIDEKVMPIRSFNDAIKSSEMPRPKRSGTQVRTEHVSLTASLPALSTVVPANPAVCASVAVATPPVSPSGSAVPPLGEKVGRSQSLVSCNRSVAPPSGAIGTAAPGATTAMPEAQASSLSQSPATLTLAWSTTTTTVEGQDSSQSAAWKCEAPAPSMTWQMDRQSPAPRTCREASFKPPPRSRSFPTYDGSSSVCPTTGVAPRGVSSVSEMHSEYGHGCMEEFREDLDDMSLQNSGVIEGHSFGSSSPTGCSPCQLNKDSKGEMCLSRSQPAIPHTPHPRRR